MFNTHRTTGAEVCSGVDPRFPTGGINCTGMSFSPLLCPSFSFHSFPPFLSVPSPCFPDIPSSLPPSPFCFPILLYTSLRPFPNPAIGLGSAVSSPAGPGGARPTNGFWCILSCKSLSRDSTINTDLHKFRGRTPALPL